MRHALHALGACALLIAAPAAAQKPPREISPAPKDLLDQMGQGVSDAELDRAVAEAAAFPLGSMKNPVRVGGPEGEHRYIARLRCADGSLPKVGMRGSAGVGAFGTIVESIRSIAARRRRARPISSLTCIMRSMPRTARR